MMAAGRWAVRPMSPWRTTAVSMTASRSAARSARPAKMAFNAALSSSWAHRRWGRAPPSNPSSQALTWLRDRPSRANTERVQGGVNSPSLAAPFKVSSMRVPR